MRQPRPRLHQLRPLRRRRLTVRGGPLLHTATMAARLQAEAARPELVEHVLSLVGSERHTSLHYGDDETNPKSDLISKFSIAELTELEVADCCQG